MLVYLKIMAESWKENIIQNKLGAKSEWSDEERAELCHQLDKDLNSHLDSLGKMKNVPKDRWTEENWKEKMADHPIFAPYLQEEESKGEVSLSELSEGLAQLKYAPEHNTLTEMTQSYKEEGINHFKYKKYRFAIASFTEGLKAKSSDKEMNAQLYNNRAAAHFHLKNYRSAIRDCQVAVELKPEYMKAIQRGFQSAVNLNCWDEAIAWCDRGLRVDSSNEDFINQRALSVKEKKRYDRDSRKKAQELKRQLEDDTRLLGEISMRRIRVGIEPTREDPIKEETLRQILLHDLEPHHPSAKQSPVHLNSSGELVWPVVFLYPEHNESDIVLEFNENSIFFDHLEAMFGPESPTPIWDSERKYKLHELVLFFEDSPRKGLVSVPPSTSLKQMLSDRRYEVTAGTPSFLVLVHGSTFLKDFVGRLPFNKE